MQKPFHFLIFLLLTYTALYLAATSPNIVAPHLNNWSHSLHACIHMCIFCIYDLICDGHKFVFMILSVTKEFVIIFLATTPWSWLRRRIPSSETRGSTSCSRKRKQQELEEAGGGGLAHPARPRDLQLLRGLHRGGPQLLQRLLHHRSLLPPGVPTPSRCHLFCYLSPSITCLIVFTLCTNKIALLIWNIRHK